LTADAESLAAARQRAAEASRAAQAARVTSGEVEDAVGESGSVFSASATETDAATSEHIARIHALYKTLPTINSLHPLLPSVLDRLRSLRAIHAGAAQASEDMNALEQRQQEMRKEIDQWREGLKVLEDKVKESEGTMKGNMEVMGPWIKDLESRLKNLGA
jgi:nuclear migration protein JNM1